ncbi:MAG: hypothetical protein BWY57_03331 [Betaproteobacteria bacterium ADurb.Bin341]|nr:MAG: hypothetical protein BWY57_03331 [Betaproteobacteria bacterium ADurb.Bin341]
MPSFLEWCVGDFAKIIRKELVYDIRAFRCSPVPFLSPFLMPIALDFLNMQHGLSVRIRALVKANMREDVGFVEVGGLITPFYRSGKSLFACRRSTVNSPFVYSKPSNFWPFSRQRQQQFAVAAFLRAR